MLIKQISVFAENRYGAIRDITAVLAEAEINIRAITIADTTDFGVVRLIVDKRKPALLALREAGMTVKETDVLALSVPDAPGALHKALTKLAEDGVMIEYSYGFVSPVTGGATIILKMDEMDKGAKCLEDNGFQVLDAEDIKF